MSPWIVMSSHFVTHYVGIVADHIVWFWAGEFMSVSVSSWVWQPCCVQKKAYHNTSLLPLSVSTFFFFSCPFQNAPWALKVLISHLGPNTQQSLNSALWLVMSLHTDWWPPQKQLLWPKLKGATIYSYKHTYLEGSLATWLLQGMGFWPGLQYRTQIPFWDSASDPVTMKLVILIAVTPLWHIVPGWPGM